MRDFGVPAELDGLIDSDPDNEGIRYGDEFIGLVNGMLIKDFIKIGYSFDTSTKELAQSVKGIKDNWEDVDEIRERLHFITMPDLTKYFKISTEN